MTELTTPQPEPNALAVPVGEVEALAEVVRLARRGVLDPGSVVKRGPDYEGNAYGERGDFWQERALTALFGPWLAARDRQTAAQAQQAERERIAAAIEALPLGKPVEVRKQMVWVNHAPEQMRANAARTARAASLASPEECAHGVPFDRFCGECMSEQQAKEGPSAEQLAWLKTHPNGYDRASLASPTPEQEA